MAVRAFDGHAAVMQETQMNNAENIAPDERGEPESAAHAKTKKSYTVYPSRFYVLFVFR